MHSLYDLCLPVLVSALTVLILGCWNPEHLQVRKHGKANGCPNYLWLALISLLAGLLAAYCQDSMKHGGGRESLREKFGYMYRR